MTSNENTLALRLVRESFGSLAAQVAALLLKKSAWPLLLLAQELSLDKKKLAEVLTVLVGHGLVEYKLSGRLVVEYSFRTDRALDRLKFHRSIEAASSTASVSSTPEEARLAELLLRELYVHGSLEMSSACLRVLSLALHSSECKAAVMAEQARAQSVYAQVSGAFTRLAQDRFVQRLPDLAVEDDAMDGTGGQRGSSRRLPLFVDPAHQQSSKHWIPTINIHIARLAKAACEDLQATPGNIRTPDEDFGDCGIHWKVNQRRVLELFRNQALTSAVENRIDKNAANILQVILDQVDAEMAEGDAANCQQSKPVTSIDIQKAMRDKHKMDSSTVDKYLSVILQDSFKVLDKIGDFSGGAYCVDFKRALSCLCLAHIESYVRERYDSRSLRIFRVILDKSKLEQKQIEDFSMIPSKECKALVYNMLNDGLLSITELSKTSDHAPSRTYYLFHVDVYLIARKLAESAYKAIGNLMVKRQQLVAENKSLLEKGHKVNSRIECLQAQGADQSEIDYERSIISADETAKLNSFAAHSDKIEMAEIQLEETICLFDTYFYYHTVAPVVAQKKS